MSSPQSQNSLFRQQQQVYRSAHFLSKAKTPTLYTPPSNDGTIKGHKRRASSEDEDMENSHNDEFRTPVFAQHPTTFEQDILHTTKRNRMSIKKDFPISKLLATLDKEKLIDLINDLVESNPHLKSEVDAFIPAPTTQSISSVIGNLEKRFIDSFPSNRSTVRDEYSFNKVKSALIDLVNGLIEYAEHFTSSTNEHPTTIFSYLHYATCVANRLPAWDNDAHNHIKKDLYDELIGYWKKAIDIASSKLHEGKIFGQQVVTEWARQILEHDTETQGKFSETAQQFKEQLGWLIGIDSNMPLSVISKNNTW